MLGRVWGTQSKPKVNWSSSLQKPIQHIAAQEQIVVDVTINRNITNQQIIAMVNWFLTIRFKILE